MRPPSAARQLAEGLLPGILVFVLLMLDPPPAATAHWIMRAYAPLMLWALMRKLREDGHLLGLLRRGGRWPAVVRPRDLAMQAALVGLLILFVAAP